MLSNRPTQAPVRGIRWCAIRRCSGGTTTVMETIMIIVFSITIRAPAGTELENASCLANRLTSISTEKQMVQHIISIVSTTVAVRAP